MDRDENLAPDVRLDHDSRTGEPIVDCRNVAVRFKVEDGEVEAVRGVSMQLYRGETIAVVGESGSGKSVTARTIMGLLSKRARVAPNSTICLDGDDILKWSAHRRRMLRGNRLSMIFQEPLSSLNPVYSIGTQIVEAIRIHQKLSKAKAREKAIDLLR